MSVEQRAEFDALLIGARSDDTAALASVSEIELRRG